MSFSGCVIGRDHHLHLVTIKEIMAGIVKTVVVHDQTTLIRKREISRRGSVAGRGLMGDSAGNGLVWSGWEGAIQCRWLPHIIL